MGEAGRLSLEESERVREDRLRLVWSRLDCLVILRNRELLRITAISTFFRDYCMRETEKE